MHTQSITAKRSRESNIELLRIVLMLMIIGFHLIVHGANLNGAEEGSYALDSRRSYGYLFLKSFLVLAVNCFVFISGYFRIRFKVGTALNLLLQTTFYSLLITLALETVPLQELGPRKLLEVVFPIFAETWWFITAYFALYLISPLLNKAIDSFTPKQFLFVVISLTSINCISGLFFDVSSMGTNRGLSLISFVHIYLLAQYVRKFTRLDEKGKWAPMVYLGSSLLIFLSALFSISYLSERGIALIFAYNNPLVLIAAIALFFTFRRIHFHSQLVNQISPYVLGVYLFHDHPLMREFLIENLFYLSSGSPLLLHFASLFLIVLLVFAAGFLVDRLRALLLNPLAAYVVRRFNLLRLERIFVLQK